MSQLTEMILRQLPDATPAMVLKLNVMAMVSVAEAIERGGSTALTPAATSDRTFGDGGSGEGY